MTTTNGQGSQIAAALVKAQAEFPAIARTHTVRTEKYSYKYADLADVLNSVGPPLRKHGIALVFLSEMTDTCPMISAVLVHQSGEMLKATLPLVMAESSQQTGSRISYLKRYLASLVTGTATEDDDDGQRGGHSAPQRARKPAKAEEKPEQESESVRKLKGHIGALATTLDPSQEKARSLAWKDVRDELSRVFGPGAIWDSAA